MRPILYLDIDDTLLIYRDRRPTAAPGAREFLLWALHRFEVRWLTRWCPSGDMEQSLMSDLCRMVELDVEILHGIRGQAWESSGSKVDGIAWLEHVVLDRPFLWIEDDYGVGSAELAFLAEHGFLGSYHCCNVTEDAHALARLRERLERALEE